MFIFWRFSLTFLSLIAALTLFAVLINSSLLNVQFSANLPVVDLSNVKIDTIIPSLLAQESLSPISTLPTTSPPTTSPPTTSSPTALSPTASSPTASTLSPTST
ncbi:10747_t:CDS:1, partial [Cetraspora pellucida]